MLQEHHTFQRNQPTVRMPRKRDDLTIRYIDGEALVYDAVTANTHHFNETALAIWEACEPHRQVYEVAHRMYDSFCVDYDEALAHVERVVKDLKDLQLVIEE